MKIILKPGVRKALQKTETTARRAAQATYKQVVQTKIQTEYALERARLRARIREIQRTIDQQMQNVGELIYATYEGNPTDSDDVQKLLEYTERLHKEMAEVKKALRGLDEVPCADVPPRFYEAPEDKAAPCPSAAQEEPQAEAPDTREAQAEEPSPEDAPNT